MLLTSSDPFVPPCSDHSYIQASHGLTTTINYSGKGSSFLFSIPAHYLPFSLGYFSGKSHTFAATIGPGPSSSSPLYSIEGTWTATSNFAKPTKEGKEGQLFLNAAIDRIPITVKDLAEQGEFESRKVWKDTADGIRRGASFFFPYGATESES